MQILSLASPYAKAGAVANLVRGSYLLDRLSTKPRPHCPKSPNFRAPCRVKKAVIPASSAHHAKKSRPLRAAPPWRREGGRFREKV